MEDLDFMLEIADFQLQNVAPRLVESIVLLATLYASLASDNSELILVVDATVD
jgi:hypothetical protein